MKPTAKETAKLQRRGSSFEHRQMESKTLPTPKTTLHTAPIKRRPSLLFESLFASESPSEPIHSHSVGALPEVKRRFSGDAYYGYETMDMGSYGDSCLSKSDSQLNFSSAEETPRSKRRRLMKRRNSQTPEMLVASSATVFLASGGFHDTTERGVDVDEVLDLSLMSLASTEVTNSVRGNASSSMECTYDSECWTKGIEIAEELVKNLKQR